MKLLILNEETKRTINTVIKNMLEFLSPTEHAFLSKYENYSITPEIERELDELYSRIGYPYKVRHTYQEVLDIPYNKNINLDHLKEVPGCYKSFFIKKKILGQWDYILSDKYLKAFLPLGYVNKSISLPMIMEDGIGWMCPVPMELNTMKESIDMAHGNVLTFGLGIGFYQYMVLLKENITSVTIVEKNPKIIQFFKKNILPQFERRNDIKIIEGDAFDYFNDNFLSHYDYCFVDIWRNNDDGYNVYKKLISQVSNLKNIDFWVERSFLYTARQYIALYFYHTMNGSLTKAYATNDPVLVRHMQAVERALDKETGEISTEEDVLFYLNDLDFIRKIVKTA